MTIQEVADWINDRFAGELHAESNDSTTPAERAWSATITVRGNNGMEVGITPAGIAYPLSRGDGDDWVQRMFRADMKSAGLLERTS